MNLAISSSNFSKLLFSVICVEKKSPVLTSHTAIPKNNPFFTIDIMKLFFFSSKRLLSITVPGVTTLITSLFTIPFAVLGSSNCSHIATL